MDRLRIAICDDVDLVRSSLATSIALDPGLQVVGSYASGQALLDSLEGLAVDVLLLDIRMPELDGPAVAERLSSCVYPPRILYVTSFPDDLSIDDALAGLVMGVLSKDLPAADLNRAIHLAAAGTKMLAPSLVAKYVSGEHMSLDVAGFARDERERDVLTLLCRGYSNERIARELHRSVSSVKQILASMSRRAGVASRTELVLCVLNRDYPTGE